MSTLKVNKLRDTAGSADAITLDPNGGAVLAGVTTVSTVKVGSGVTISSDGDVFTTGITTSSTVIVGSGVTISESGIEASGIGITCANINGTQLGGRRNIIINGAMEVAQRGTTETGSAANGYSTVDRIQLQQSGTDDYPETAQGDVASGTTPYTEGFRKTFKVTNGNQSTGGQAGDELGVRYSIEAQDVAKCGWNYKSASSFITLSFWVKSSVAQNFYGYLLSLDGTMQRYAFETGSLSADTWTKVTKTIPGNSNIAIDDNNAEGFRIEWRLFAGTDYTDSGVSLNTWASFAGGKRTPDSTSKSYTTNDATFELTGVQFEVGSQATPFEHRSYQEEIQLCYRYYYKLQPGAGAYFGSGFWYSSNSFICHVDFPVVMRTNLTAVEQSGTASHYKVIHNSTTSTCSSVPSYLGDANNTSQSLNFSFSGSGTQGQGGLGRSGDASAYFAWDAEL